MSENATSRKVSRMSSFAKELFDTDDEVLTSKPASDVQNSKVSKVSEINEMIGSRYNELRSKYPNGGVKTVRVITPQAAIKAPAGFFDKFANDVKDGTDYVQLKVTEEKKSDTIADARNSPGDEALQEIAFSAMSNHITDFLGSKAWRGVDRIIIIELIVSEIIGFSALDPLWRSKQINEIMCDGPRSVKIEIRGKKVRVPSIKFRDSQHLTDFVNRLLAPQNKIVSRNTPILKGRLYDKSRLHVIGTAVAPDGPNVNIRRHHDDYWEASRMITTNTISKEALVDLGNLINKGCSFLVVGSTGTGKTTTLNALTGFYPDDVRIVTLEDSLEMKPHPKKQIAAGMECIALAPGQQGVEVKMRDLVKASTQMAPDVLVLGEVTDGAAYDLVQALNTGHAGSCTLHANSPKETIPRLLSLIGQGGVLQAESSLPMIAAAFDFIIFLTHYPMDGSRKISSIVEVPSEVDYDTDGGVPNLNLRELWKFDNITIDDGKVNGEWVKKNDISDDLIERRSMKLSPELTWEDLEKISKVGTE